MNSRKRAGISILLAFGIYVLICGRGVTELTAAAAAVMVHEAGHLAAMAAMGMRLDAMSVEPGGLCIRYSGGISPGKELITVLAGPVFGVVYALLPLDGEWYSLSAGLSMVYSAFNCLPMLPLDGGRVIEIIFKTAGERGALRILQRAFAEVITGAGAVFALTGRGAGLLCAGIWLVFYQFDGKGLVNH